MIYKGRFGLYRDRAVVRRKISVFDIIDLGFLSQQNATSGLVTDLTRVVPPADKTWDPEVEDNRAF